MDSAAPGLTTIRRNHCELPQPPENGKFSCEINDTSNMENDLSIAHGSICRIRCNQDYSIHHRQHKYSVFQCQYGKWNSTVTNVCKSNNY